MAYFSMCVCEIKGIEPGAIYQTYHEEKTPKEMIGIRPVDKNGKILTTEYIYLESREFYNHFESLMYFSCIDIRRKRKGTGYRFIGMLGKTKYQEESLRLRLNLDDYMIPDYLILVREVMLPLLKLKFLYGERYEYVLGEFWDVLKYTLEALETFYKNKNLGNYEEAVEKAALLSNEIYNYGVLMLQEEKEESNKVKEEELKGIARNYNRLIDNYISDLQGVKSQVTD